MAKKKPKKTVSKKTTPKKTATLDEVRLRNREIQRQQMAKLAQIYEDSLEPKVVILYRRLEEMIARSKMSLTHISLILDMLKQSCIEQATDKYVTNGHKKLDSMGLEKKDG